MSHKKHNLKAHFLPVTLLLIGLFAMAAFLMGSDTQVVNGSLRHDLVGHVVSVKPQRDGLAQIHIGTAQTTPVATKPTLGTLSLLAGQTTEFNFDLPTN